MTVNTQTVQNDQTRRRFTMDSIQGQRTAERDRVRAKRERKAADKARRRR